MTRPIRRFFRVLKWLAISVVVILAVGWVIIYYYVYINKQPLLDKISKEAGTAIAGEVSIGDLSVIFWRDFPEINLELSNVSIRDSLYAQHQKALLTAERIYVKANMPSLFTRISEVEKVIVEHANFHLFVDTTGYSNGYILKSRHKQQQEIVEKKKREIYLFFARLYDVHVLIENDTAQKKFEFQINEMQASVVNEDTSISISAATDAQIGMLGFNLTKGPFLENKKLDATLQLIFRKPSKQLVLPLQTVSIEDEQMQLGLLFDFGQKPPSYQVEIVDSAVDYRKGLALLNDHLRSRLALVGIEHPVCVHAQLKGNFVPRDKPWVKVDFKAEDNMLHTEFGALHQASFTGFYTNNFQPELGNHDTNSVIVLSSFDGLYNGHSPIKADTVMVHNLKKGQTYLYTHVQSKFDIVHLNSLLDKSIAFRKGKAQLDLTFAGHIDPNKQSERNLDGFLRVSDAQMIYKPRNMTFSRVNADFEFKEDDVLIKKMDLHKGKSSLYVKGSAKNFLKAYFSSPELMQIDAQAYSPLVDLNDFKSLLASPAAPTLSADQVLRRRKNKMQLFNQKISQLLSQGNLQLRLLVDRVTMNSFEASQVAAHMDLLTHQIVLRHLKLHHAGGTVELEGVVNQNALNNPFELNGRIDHVNIDEFLEAFDNFGMKSVTGENIKGVFTSDIDIQGNFTDAGDLIRRSIKGQVNFVLTEAAFINFTPFKEIKRYGLKNRNLDSIQFWDIKNNLFIQDGKVIIFPMEIRNNALNIFVKGIYAFDRGTDLSIEIPLANPKKDNERVASGIRSKRKGLKIYLRAQDDEYGNVRIGWDPLKKGEDAVDAKLHLTEDGELRPDIWDDPQEIFNEQREQDATNELTEKPHAKPGFFRRILNFFKLGFKDSGQVKE